MLYPFVFHLYKHIFEISEETRPTILGQFYVYSLMQATQKYFFILLILYVFT